MKFRPLHDRVVVKRIEAEEKSAGGSANRTDRVTCEGNSFLDCPECRRTV